MVNINESFLQYLWQHRLLEGSFFTTDGQPVSIDHPGFLNRDAGPDFSQARIRIGQTIWVGNVEIHIRASDWNRHCHSLNRAFDNVVLHVVYENDSPVTLQNGHPLPTLQIKNHIPQPVWDNYTALINPPAPSPVPCADKLPSLSPHYIHTALERLLLERIEQKCDNVRRLLAASHGDWEQCAYILLAHYFGGKVNAFPFELLAQSTPQTLLARWSDRPVRIEALLMGQAGFLSGYFEDDFPRQLQSDYEALRQGAGLNPLSAHMWRFFRLRPYGFPTIRISQFAQVICRSHNLFSHLLESTSPLQLRQLFDVAASPYWDNHYRFDVPSPGSPKRLGSSFIDRLIINAWAPLLYEYGNAHSLQHYKDRAVDVLMQLPPEQNNVLSKWKKAGIDARSAAESQALLQLHQNYCSQHLCLNCQIGYKIITN